jgi:CubicO group peptidase (beta-lactamase class C family)
MSRVRANVGFAVVLSVGLTALASWTQASSVQASPAQARSKPSGAAQTTKQEPTQRELSSRLLVALEEARADENLDGLSAGVWLGEQVVLSGWVARDPDAEREGLTEPRTAPWLIEPFTALALLRMSEADKLALSDPLAKHLPEFVFGGKVVTVAQVLTHTSGIPSYVDHLATKPSEATARSVLAWLAQRPLDAEAGSCFAYSESNALLATALAEKLAEKPLEKVLMEWVTEPARLIETTFEAGETARNVREASFRVSGSPADAASVARLVGMARITTTLDDLSLLMRALERDSVLSSHARSLLLGADRLPGGVEAPYSYGFVRSRLEREPFLSLGGASSEAALRVSWRPATSLVVASATRSAAANLAAVNERLGRVVFEIPEQEIVDLPLTGEQCAVYAGVYYMGCTRTTIEARDEQLYFQSPYEGPYRLRYQGEHRFVAAPDEEVTFEFKVDSGVASEFVLSHHGARTGAVRVK